MEDAKAMQAKIDQLEGRIIGLDVTDERCFPRMGKFARNGHGVSEPIKHIGCWRQVFRIRTTDSHLEGLEYQLGEAIGALKGRIDHPDK